MSAGPALAPAACLIVTCRDANDFEGAWLITGQAFKQDIIARPMRVVVSDFDDDEVLDLAEHSLSAELAEKIRQCLRNAQAQPLAPNAPQHTAAIVVPALLHPAMWGSFVRLGTDDKKASALDDVPAAVEELAGSFVEWFCHKVDLRQPNLRPKRDWRQMLVAVAEAYSPQDGGSERTKHWSQPATCGSIYTIRDGDLLYQEALSSGLIREERKGRWNWRHGFVGEYLAKQGGPHG